VPKLAETAEGALAWELETGAVRADRVARERGDSELTAFNAAADAALALAARWTKSMTVCAC
jgi:hypothetical protein